VVELHVRVFLTLTLDSDEKSNSRSGCFNSGGKSPSAKTLGGL
jgi:hypothetical protein